MLAKETITEKRKNENKCLHHRFIHPLSFFLLLLFPPHFHPESYFPVLSEYWENQPLNVCVCDCQGAGELRRMGLKELFSEHSTSPGAGVARQLCVPLPRDENITKMFSNYCWPFLTFALLQPRNEHPCVRIGSFFALGETTHPHRVIYEA